MKLYNFYADDYYLPAVCSGWVHYFMTMPMAETFICGLPERFEKTKKAFEDYKNGDKNAVHNVAYSEQLLLSPVEPIKVYTTVLNKQIREFENAWQCMYYFGFEKAKVQQIIIKFENCYCKAIRAIIYDLKNGCSENELDYIHMPTWGHPNFYKTDGKNVESRVFKAVQWYETKEDALADIKNIEFSPLFEEVVGDG